jgi:hypothetical protein
MYFTFAYIRVWIVGRLTRNSDTGRCAERSTLHFKVLVPSTHATKYPTPLSRALQLLQYQDITEVCRASCWVLIVASVRGSASPAKKNKIVALLRTFVSSRGAVRLESINISPAREIPRLFCGPNIYYRPNFSPIHIPCIKVILYIIPTKYIYSWKIIILTFNLSIQTFNYVLTTRSPFCRTSLKMVHSSRNM